MRVNANSEEFLWLRRGGRPGRGRGKARKIERAFILLIHRGISWNFLFGDRSLIDLAVFCDNLRCRYSRMSAHTAHTYTKEDTKFISTKKRGDFAEWREISPAIRATARDLLLALSLMSFVLFLTVSFQTDQNESIY